MGAGGAVVAGGSVVVVVGAAVVVGASVVVVGASVVVVADNVVVVSVVAGGMADGAGPVGADGPMIVVVSSDPVVVVTPEFDGADELDELLATGAPPPHAISAPATTPTHANQRSFHVTA